MQPLSPRESPPPGGGGGSASADEDDDSIADLPLNLVATHMAETETH